jgi:hypothetical protein
MKPEKLLEDLKTLAEQIGIHVIIDKGNFVGGHCLVYEERKIVLNRHLPPEVKAAKLAQGLGQFSLEEFTVKPALREFIEREKRRVAERVLANESSALAQQLVQEALN